MKQYLDALKTIADKGNTRGDRTGTGTRSIFGLQQEYDLAAGFPLVTTKKVNLRAIIQELLWFLQGNTDNNWLKDRGVSIWNEWALPDGRLGPIYGKQWRHWETTRITGTYEKELTDGQILEFLIRDGYTEQAKILLNSAFQLSAGAIGKETHQEVRVNSALVAGFGTLSRTHNNFETVVVDQIAELIKGLKEKPYSRRHIVNAWNVADLPDESIKPQANVENGQMALAPCHTMFQFYAEDLTLAEMLNIAPANIRRDLVAEMGKEQPRYELGTDEDKRQWLSVYAGVPRMRLSCKLYQR